MKLNKSITIILALAAILLYGCSNGTSITVTNDSDLPRTGEVVEVSDSAAVASWGAFHVEDADGAVVPSQVLNNGHLVFPVNVGANAEAVYKIAKGDAADADTTLAYTYRADCQDDVAWENEHSGYRLYGPSFRAQGGKVHGYDIWCKRGDKPIVQRLYDLDHGPEKISYHKDHGEGFDGFTVGPTLGCGGCALMLGDTLLYSTAYKDYEVVDYGPVRLTIKFTIDTLVYDGTAVVEERYVTLDRGSCFNKVQTTFCGLDRASDVAAGLVVHADNPNGYESYVFEGSGIAIVTDLSDDRTVDNGEIYMGVVVPGATSASFMPFAEVKANAVGQVIVKREVAASQPFEYYFGSSWSKGSVKDLGEWSKIVDNKAIALAKPLKVTVK